MNHKCPKCNKVIAKEDLRVKSSRKVTSTLLGTLTQEENLAPKVKCNKCGLIIVLLRGMF